MPKDNGGWRSKGSIAKPTRCPKCKNDDARLLEIISRIYGKTTKTPLILCNVCSGTFEEEHGDSEK